MAEKLSQTLSLQEQEDLAQKAHRSIEGKNLRQLEDDDAHLLGWDALTPEEKQAFHEKMAKESFH